MESLRYQTRDEIKPRLKSGDIARITEMLNGKLTYAAVRAQLSGMRTLKKPVIEAANKIIELREQHLGI